MPKNKQYWELDGEELEEHLAFDCSLSIIEPMETQEYFTPEERALMNQFPKDAPEPPEYDEVLTVSLDDPQGFNTLYRLARNATPVGEIFATARFLCLRVKYV